MGNVFHPRASSEKPNAEAHRKEVPMLKTSTFVSAFITLAAIAFVGHAQASQQTNLAGTYRCGPDAKACQWSGTTFTVTQSGNSLEAKNEKNAVGTATLTSNISLSAG